MEIEPGFQKIWQPLHAFFGNPEKQIIYSKVFNHKYEESEVIF